MKCPEFQIILDLIDGRLDRTQNRKIETHVNECSNCAEKLKWAKASLGAMKNSALVDAPDYVIQRGISIFPKKTAKFSDWVLAKLSFDSWVTPQLAGVRGEDSATRQRIYQTDTCKIILMNEPDRWIGQIVPTQPGIETAGCLVELTTKHKVLKSTITNKNGEFILAVKPTKNAEIKIHGPEAIVVRDLK